MHLLNADWQESIELNLFTKAGVLPWAKCLLNMYSSSIKSEIANPRQKWNQEKCCKHLQRLFFECFQYDGRHFAHYAAKKSNIFMDTADIQ